MSDYAFVAERARKAFASVSRLEAALSRRPEDRSLQLNLSSMKKFAEQVRSEMLRIAALNSVEVCNYRLSPEVSDNYALAHVSKSFLHYQYLFSQIYDAVKNGPKGKAVLGHDATEESALNFAYSYSGSLGIVLLAKSERSFFDGNLDEPIKALYQVFEIEDSHNVRDIAKSLGNAVVKRIHDWSAANVEGGFAVDIKWKRSDGQEFGQVIDRRHMERIVELIDRTSDEETNPLVVDGILVGINVETRTFHFVVVDGEALKGRLSDEFPMEGATEVPRAYRAEVIKTEKFHYATERQEIQYVLIRLAPLRVSDT